MATIVNANKHEPKATDLDYYSQPENYTGANLQAFQRFIADKSKEENAHKKSAKKMIVKDAKYYFFQRYKHILDNVIFLDELIEREHSEEEEDDTQGDTIAPATHDTMHTTTEGFLAKPVDSKSALTDKTLLVAASAGESTLDRNTSPDSANLGIPAVKTKSVVLSQSPSCRQTDAARKAAFDKVAKEQRAQQARALFKRSANHVRAMCIISSPTRNKTPGGGGGTFMDIASSAGTGSESMKNAGLSFDVSYYKANREINLSSECKNILTMDPSLREPEMIQTVMFGLQSLKSYAEYPLHMQEKLAKVAWYAVVAPKRMIIRQGHYAENFYFILSGHAVVTILLKDKAGVPFVKTATVMKKGMSFGELALLHHSKRTATVTTQDTVQLLSIGREDFFDIFMSGDGEDNMPSHIRYISHLDFMKNWPIEKLVDSPEHCLLHFYKRNTIIVSNSNNSEWLYIVKAGSCVILKKLKGVTPKHFLSTPKTSDLELLPDPLQAIVFDSKVNTGLRKRNRNKRPVDEKIENFTDITGQHGYRTKKKFNPARKSTYYSKSLARRKNYKSPQECVPKANKESPEPVISSKPEPVFVQVKILKQKDVFGLDTVIFEDDIQRTNTAFTLVSRGAECIMLSKAFYAKHANAKVKRWMRESTRPYPDEDVFQENLQIKEDWMLYKKTMLDDMIHRVKETSHRLDSK